MKDNKNWYKEIKKKYFPDGSRCDITREEVEQELKKEKYKNIKEWMNKPKSSYNWTRKQTWYSEIKEKYFPDRVRFDRTKEDIEEELKKEKYKTIQEWVIKNNPSYQFARNKKWYKELRNKFFPNAVILNRTRKMVEQELKNKKYKSIKQWQKNSPSNKWASTQPWYAEIKEKYFPDRLRSDRTREEIEKELKKKKYKNIKDWYKKNGKSYSWANKQIWYPEIRARYFPDNMVRNYTKEDIEKELRKENYINLHDWEKNSPTYQWANRQPWYSEIKNQYFPNARSLNLSRTRKDIIKELKKEKYKRIIDWIKNNRNSYSWAQTQPWYPEIKKKYFSNAKS